MCPEEYRSTVMIDGEEVLSCVGGNWLETDSVNKLFNACCIFLPLSLALAFSGYAVRREADDRFRVSDPLENQKEGKFSVNISNKNNTLIDNTTKVIQFSILGVSITLSVLTIVGTILIIIFFILAIYLLLSSGSFFA